MPTLSTSPNSTLRRRSSLLRGLTIGLVTIVASGVITACTTTATEPTAQPAAVATTAPTEAASEPAATVAPAEAASTPTAQPEATLSVMPAAPAGRGAPGGGTTAIVATPTVQDVAYASLSPTQKLDLYLPEGDGPFPLIINVHGGGFMMGDKSNPAEADTFLANGYAVASVDYRLSGEALAPAQIEDLKAAVRWLRANAQEYNLDPERFAAFGQSAGGNLVALLGTSCGVAELEGAELGSAEQSSCVQAVVDWFGPTDFLQMDQQFAGTSCPATHDAADSPESMLLGAPIQTVPEQAQAVNPITYVTPDAPPFLIQHGTADCNVPPQQGQLLYDALEPAIGADNVTLTFLEGAGHGGAQFSEAANMQLVLDFLGRHLQ
ncbi:MAG TPA: alpha/beta hydrolase [Anaerolineae bacterium]|nr:alpha/beta hydrolase [Anaerolineae bacterium]